MKVPFPRAPGWKAACIALLLLAPAFFFLSHELDYAYEGASIERSDDHDSKINLEERALEGNLPRRVALLSLGIFSLLGMIFTTRQTPLTCGEPLGWVFILFGIWSLASVLWSIDVPLTIRKLITFGIFCLVAALLTSRFPVRFVPECLLILTVLYITVGLSVEVASGAFQPLSGDYRFAGTVHPNVQAVNCAMMLFASVSLADGASRRRRIFLLSAAAALVLLILTKSRTSLACAMFAVMVFFIVNSPNRWRTTLYLSGFICCAVIVYLFLEQYQATGAKEIAYLGRESEETLTLTGRTSIWEKGLAFIGMRPVHGYGFNSFWTPLHIRIFSDSMGWNIADVHSAYLDLLLSTGVVGLLLHLAVLTLGIRSASLYSTGTRDAGYGFLLMVFLFYSVHGFMESVLIQISSLESFVFLWGIFHLGFLSPEWRENPI